VELQAAMDFFGEPCNIIISELEHNPGILLQQSTYKSCKTEAGTIMTALFQKPLIVNDIFQIHCPHCYSSPPKFD